MPFLSSLLANNIELWIKKEIHNKMKLTIKKLDKMIEYLEVILKNILVAKAFLEIVYFSSQHRISKIYINKNNNNRLKKLWHKLKPGRKNLNNQMILNL